MSDGPTSQLPTWSDDEAALLRKVDLVAEILRRMKPGSSATPLWQRLLNSASIVAVIGLLGTAIIGNLVTGWIQDKAKEKEIAVTVHKESLDAQLASVKKAFELAGAYLAASENLITISREAFQDRPEEKAAFEKEYNTVDAQWRRDAEGVGFLISYYHLAGGNVRPQWLAAKASVEEFNRCAVQYHADSRKRRRVTECQKHYDAAQAAFAELARVLEAARREVYSRWGVKP
jgi:septal ring factor EnvC (AmiA/AmiB activator)